MFISYYSCNFSSLMFVQFLNLIQIYNVGIMKKIFPKNASTVKNLRKLTVYPYFYMFSFIFINWASEKNPFLL